MTNAKTIIAEVFDIIKFVVEKIMEIYNMIAPKEGEGEEAVK